MMSLRFVLVVSLCWVFVSCKVLNLEINDATKLCSSKQTVQEETEVTVAAKGSIPAANCSLVFNTDDSTGKCGICFQFEKYAYFNTSLVSLALTAGSNPMVIDKTEDFPELYICSDDSSLSLTLTHTDEYTNDPDQPGYMFVLDIFNKCGYRGTAKSVPFDEAVKHAKGYHHGQEKIDSREVSNFVTGLVVGLCSASVFLVVLFLAWCYVKNRPNEPKSADTPMGGK